MIYKARNKEGISKPQDPMERRHNSSKCGQLTYIHIQETITQVLQRIQSKLNSTLLSVCCQKPYVLFFTTIKIISNIPRIWTKVHKLF